MNSILYDTTVTMNGLDTDALSDQEGVSLAVYSERPRCRGVLSLAVYSERPRCRGVPLRYLACAFRS